MVSCLCGMNEPLQRRCTTTVWFSALLCGARTPYYLGSGKRCVPQEPALCISSNPVSTCTRPHAEHVLRVCLRLWLWLWLCARAAFQDDDVKVSIGQPDPESAGSTPVAFVEGRINCAAATAVMDMQVR